MSSYVFQFFCAPDSFAAVTAAGNSGSAAQAVRPNALTAPPPRPRPWPRQEGLASSSRARSRSPIRHRHLRRLEAPPGNWQPTQQVSPVWHPPPRPTWPFVAPPAVEYPLPVSTAAGPGWNHSLQGHRADLQPPPWPVQYPPPGQFLNAPDLRIPSEPVRPPAHPKCDRKKDQGERRCPSRQMGQVTHRPTMPVVPYCFTSDEESMFDTIFNASVTELEDQIAGREPHDTFPTAAPLTPFLQYCFYVFQHKSNPLHDKWLLFRFHEAQCGRARKQVSSHWVVSWSLCTDAIMLQTRAFVLSRFPECLPAASVEEAVLTQFCKILWTSRCPFQECMERRAYAFKTPSSEAVVLAFPVAHFPGPPKAPGEWAAWVHGTDLKGAQGILASGRVLATAKQTLSLKLGQTSFSFFCRCSSNPDWIESWQDMIGAMHWSTKNSCGIVFSGRIAGEAFKAQGANVSLENALCKFHPFVHSPAKDKRWCVREINARIDTIFLVSGLNEADFPHHSTQFGESLPPIQDRPSHRRELKPGFLAIEDQSWGPWKPSTEGQNSQPSEPPQQSLEDSDILPEGEAENLMASSSVFAK